MGQLVTIGGGQTGLNFYRALFFLKLIKSLNNQDKPKKGGARAGAGRKRVHDEIAARELAVKAIVTKFGSLEQGMVKLLESEEPTLVKFVWEHAIGKTPDKVIHKGDEEAPVIFQIDGRFKKATKDH